MATILVLLFNALARHPQVWVIFLADTAIVASGSLQQPSITALNQSLVPHDLQRAASTLSMIRYTTAAIVGPAFGGLVAVAVGPAAAYVVNLVTFTASLALLVTLRADPRAADRETVSLGAGLRYARSRPDLMGTYVVDLLAMAWAYPVVMLPFVAARYHATYALAVLYLGLPIGTLLATLTSSWTHRVHHYGRAVVLAATLWGLGIALFGNATSLWFAEVGLIIGGGADAVSGIFRQTMWNESISPDVRGRMAGVELISYAVGPTAGQFRAGVTAAWTTLRFSLTIGGLGCAGSVAAVSTGLKSMWRFDARTDPHVAEVRAQRDSATEAPT
jgi:MFS family permease